MIKITLIGLLIKIFIAVVAYIAIRIVLRRFDKAARINFKQWVQNAKPETLGHYFSYRMLGACILFGLILSS